MIYTVLIKLMHRKGSIQQSNTLKKHHCRVYGVRLYKYRGVYSTDVLWSRNMIAGVVGYDSIRKHLAECGYHTAEIREKYYL